MHIGLSRPKAPAPPIPDVDAAFVAHCAEAAGFESILYGEHPITPLSDGVTNVVHTEGVPYFQDAVVALARVSAATKRIKFGFGICIVVQHNPVRLAKQLAGLDYYSGGRLLVGIGTGWNRVETEALGGRFEQRWAQTEEAIELARALWTQDRVEHRGRFFKVDPVRCFPQPAQAGGPPILMGAGSDLALKRLAKYCDGWMPAFVTPDAIANGAQTIRAGRAKVRAFARELGREMNVVPVTAILRGDATRDDLKRFEDEGVERVAISLPYFETEAGARDKIEKLAAALL
ncbi:MAG: TIGR03619 family F420-dependent LLM class oxidoreductase [Caulobacterales bacterium]